MLGGTFANKHLNSWSLLVGLIIIVALSTAAWFLSPKGDNQT
jgi:V-type H+-transporting ATPase subunit e